MTAEPPDSVAMQSVLAEPIRAAESLEIVGADRPEEFLQALSATYRSAYFSASDVQEE